METLQIEPEKIDLESKIEDVCKDSIQIFSLVMAFEKKFNYKVKYEDLMRIETIRDIINLVSRLEKEGEILI